MNATLETLLGRRSIRVYQDRPVPRAVKDQILQAALRAPTAGNMMLYSIIEVNDPHKKQVLARTCDNQPFIAHSAWLLLFLADFQRWNEYFVRNDVTELCTRLNMPRARPSEANLLLACCDSLLAAQNAVIAAESLGIGSCYIGDIMERYEEHRQLFALPDYTFPIALLCLGYPKTAVAKRPLSSRFAQKFVVFADEYHALTENEMQEMFAEWEKTHFPGQSFADGASNAAQHFYLKKIASPFALEMTRSVREAMKAWRT